MGGHLQQEYQFYFIISNFLKSIFKILTLDWLEILTYIPGPILSLIKF